MDDLRSRLVGPGGDEERSSVLRFVPKSDLSGAPPPPSASAVANSTDSAAEAVQEVKTLIWEAEATTTATAAAQRAAERGSDEEEEDEENGDEGGSGSKRISDRFHFVVALRAEDRIDEEKLLAHVMASFVEEKEKVEREVDEGKAAATSTGVPSTGDEGRPGENQEKGAGCGAVVAENGAVAGPYVSMYRDDDGILRGEIRRSAEDDEVDEERGGSGESSSLSSELAVEARLTIRLADCSVAEGLTGCASGAIPPVGHVTPMPLYVDEALLFAPPSPPQAASSPSLQNPVRGGNFDSDNGEESTAGARTVDASLVVSVGSGCRDHSLHMPLTFLLEAAQQCGAGARICSIAESGKEKLRSYLETTAKANGGDGIVRKDRAPAPDRGTSSPSEKPVHPTPKSLSKRLRDAAMKQGGARLVKELIEEAGEDFPEHMGFGADTYTCTKNALHLAAWKGDLETIDLLLDAGKSFGLDLMNSISTGPGNYGKTPIFYALTQGREDAVLLLVQRGADLLIINNKGQSPCSMAAGHLSEEACRILYEAEAEQIRQRRGLERGQEEEGTFRNYRASHSDGRQYGDLDPRVEIDDDNYGDDLAEELEAFKQAVKDAIGGGDDDDDDGDDDDDDNVDVLIQSGEVHTLLPPTFVPRCLRRTNAKSRMVRDRALRNAAALEARRRKGLFDDHSKRPASSTTVIEIGDTKITRRPPPVRPERCASCLDDEVRDDDKTATKQSAEEGRPEEGGCVLDVGELPVMSMADLCSMEVGADINEATAYCVVDSLAVIESLAKDVDAAVRAAAERRGEDPSVDNVPQDSHVVESAWGLDCEWKPTRISGTDNPVATLQLSTLRRSYLIDLQTLCQQGVKDAAAPLTEAEGLVCDALSRLLSDPDITIVGFSIAQDIAKLAVSYPHLPCFRLFEAVIDLESLARNVHPNAPKHYMSSLAKAVAILLRRRLDKKQQCSDWAQRPLTGEQVDYALLDAAVLPKLLKEMMSAKSNPLLERYAGRFFSKQNHLRSSWRFTVLDAGWIEHSTDPKEAYRTENGAFKKCLSVFYARQTWPTGTDAPVVVQKVPIDKQREPKEPIKKPEKKEAKSEARLSRRDRRKKTMIRLSSLSAAYETLPKPGSFLGYTKEDCVHSLLGRDTVEHLSSGDHYLGFNRRGGIIEMANSWLLFINFGAGEVLKRFQNTFSGDGRSITFSVNPSKELHWSMLESISARNCTTKEEQQKGSDFKRILLFIRPSANSEFLFCGDCRCQGINKSETGYVNLVLELEDFDALVPQNDQDGASTAYSTLILHHNQNIAAMNSLVLLRD